MECTCWQEVSRLNEDWDPVEMWLVVPPAGQGSAVIQVRDRDGSELLTVADQIHWCPKCGRYLG